LKRVENSPCGLLSTQFNFSKVRGLVNIDTVVGGLVSLIAGYYFGHKRKEENDKITYEKIKEQ